MRRFGVLGKAPRAGTASRRGDRDARTAVSLADRSQPTPTARSSSATDGPGSGTVAVRVFRRARGSTPRGLLHPLGDHARARAGRPTAARSTSPAAASPAAAARRDRRGRRAPGATTRARMRSAAARRTSRRLPPRPLAADHHRRPVRVRGFPSVRDRRGRSGTTWRTAMRAAPVISLGAGGGVP
jgi:hypothetical protein